MEKVSPYMPTPSDNRGPVLYLCPSTIALRGTPAQDDLGNWPTMETAEDRAIVAPTQDEIDEESRRIRRLRILVQLTVDTIAEGGLSAEEAAGMIAATRRVALEMFPGKERAFDLLYRPQFQRVMHAVYCLQ
jgi:hypothetical protein